MQRFPATPTRRDVLSGAGAALVAAPAGAAPSATASPGTTPSAAAGETQPAGSATAHGTVFDADSNPRAGLSGIMVSNGLDVVRTDAQGRWTLPVRDGDSVFVIKPAGWGLPLDPATSLPRFAYIHAPTGSPALGFRFPGVAPTGSLPDSIDFALHRQAEDDRFNAVLFTDPQPESLYELGFVRDDVVAAVPVGQAAFGITHGDIMFDDLAYYGRYNRIVGTLGLPWFNCRGNHDMNVEAPDNTHAAETFKRVYGARWMAFQHARVTFIVLDNVDYLGPDPSKPNNYGKYRGFFGDRQLGFVRNVLAGVPHDDLVVISFHIPLRTHVIDDAANNTVDRKAFLEAIGTHPNTVSFCGHTHTNEHWYFGAADGYAAGSHHHHVLAAVSGSWWSGPFDARGIPLALQSDGSPNGFHILSVDGARYTTTLVPAHDPAHGQIRIMLDSQVHDMSREVTRTYRPAALYSGPVAADALASTRLVVNLFDGGPRSKVEVAFGQRPAAAMTKVDRLDPFVVETYDRNPDTKKPWVEAVRSSHIWQLSLPADLPVGAHRVHVRASDEYGRPHDATLVLEVTA